MRSVVIEKPNQLTLEERPIPLPGKNEVRVRIKSASICGSDIHIWHGHNPFAKYPREYLSPKPLDKSSIWLLEKASA